MNALKKTQVAALIMLLCVVLAFVIGEAKKDYYINPTAHEGSVFYEITTAGAIQEIVSESTGATWDPDLYENTGSSHSGSILGPILALVIIFLVIRGFGKKK